MMVELDAVEERSSVRKELARHNQESEGGEKLTQLFNCLVAKSGS